MSTKKSYDVIIVGGSYAGLAAGMALGRALMKVLIIDDGKPCNRQTPFSHNFLTNDGKSPAAIAALANQQVRSYDTVSFFHGLATSGIKTHNGFEVQVMSGETFGGNKLIFATGIRDLLPGIEGLAACWGISVLHCPYCHGYEVREAKTGVLANGETAYDLCRLLLNWTKDLTLFTNGPAALTGEQIDGLRDHKITMVEKEIDRLKHDGGHLQHLVFKDGSTSHMKALYAAVPFNQQCFIPASLGCEMTVDGYLKVDQFYETTVDGVFACGDNVSRMRTLANAISMGTTAGMVLSKQMILEQFQGHVRNGG